MDINIAYRLGIRVALDNLWDTAWWPEFVCWNRDPTSLERGMDAGKCAQTYGICLEINHA